MRSKTESYPSVFAIAVVFGGTLGMTIASLAGYESGAGFLFGSAAVFLTLGAAVLVARHRERLVHEAVVMSSVAAAAGLSISDFAEFIKKNRSHIFQRIIDDAVLNASGDTLYDVVADRSSKLSERQREVLRERLREVFEQSKKSEGGDSDWRSSSGASS